MTSVDGKQLVQIPDVFIIGTITAVNQTLAINIPSGMSAWTVQVSGTFVGDLCSELSAGGGANFQNSIVESRGLEQYYSAVAGNNVGFAASVGAVSIGSTGGLVGIFNNPSNSGLDAYISRVIVGANRAGYFERWRQNTTQPTITGAAVANANRGGATSTGTCKLYTPANATLTGGTLSKTVFLNANTSDTTIEDGASIVRPGQSLYWYYNPDGANVSLGTVDLVWWESVSTT